MVWKTTVVDITFSSLGVFICGTGLYILLNVRKTKMDKTQWYIITNLCILDFCSCCTLTLNSALFISDVKYSVIVAEAFADIFMVGYYGATLWLVFDRYLHIKLNLKYFIYWSKKKTTIFTLILWSFSILSGVLLRLYHEKAIFFLLIAFDVVIIICSIFVYGKAIAISCKTKTIKRSYRNRRSVFKGLLLTSVILLAYVVLMAIPDIIIIYNYADMENWSIAMYSYLNICYIVAMWIDSFVYIVICPQSLTFLKNKQQSFRKKTFSVRENPIYYLENQKI